MTDSLRTTWNAVDAHLAEQLLEADAVLDAALADSDAAGLPPIAVSPTHGRFLELLARIHGARTILEIGTLGGYSTICLGRALPEGGRLVSLELDPHHATVARRNIARAGLEDRVEVRVGPALESLAALAAEPDLAPFDLVFIDADKDRLADYLEGSLALSRPGTVIVADNVVRNGAILDPDIDNPSIRGVQRFLAALHGHPRLRATALQTVGVKGYDGFALAVVTA